MTFKYILWPKPQVSENSNNKTDCELSADYLRSLNSVLLAQVSVDQKNWVQSERQCHSFQCTIVFVPSVRFLSAHRLACEQNFSFLSALSQACPGAGGKLWIYGLCQLKSCSCSLLLLETWSNFMAWSFQRHVSYPKEVINNSLEDILKCHCSWLNPVVDYYSSTNSLRQ